LKATGSSTSGERSSFMREVLTRELAGHRIVRFGVADAGEYRVRFPEAGWRLDGHWPRAVVLVYPLLAGVLDSLDGAPNHLYFHHYRQVNYHLDRAALAVAGVLEDLGRKALPVAASQTLDARDLTAHLSHRHLALLAGLGWRGKNNLLVTPEYGTRCRLVTVLTDAPLVPDSPGEEEGCGDCVLCRRACPAGAIGAEAVDFQRELCVEQLALFRRIPRVGQHVCGLCQKACVRFQSGGTSL